MSALGVNDTKFSPRTICLECHSHFSDEEIVAQLDDLDGNSFERFNTASVNHLAFIVAGTNGQDAIRSSIAVLHRFSDWYRLHRPDKYYPRFGLEPMYPLSEIDNLIELGNNNLGMARSVPNACEDIRGVPIPHSHNTNSDSA